MVEGNWDSPTPHVQMPIPSRPDPAINRWSSRPRVGYIPACVKDSLEAVRRDQDAAFDRLIRRIDRELARRPSHHQDRHASQVE